MFDSEDEKAIGAVCEKAAKSLLREAVSKVQVYWPYMYAPESDGMNGEAVSDPLTLGLVDHDEGVVLAKLSIREDLESDLEDLALGGYDVKQFKVISAALKTLAEKIDAAVRSAQAVGESNVASPE